MNGVVADGPEGCVALGTVVLVRAGDRYVAVRRVPACTHNPGAWEVPCGKIEDGEEPVVAARREVEEETGLVVSLDQRPLHATMSRVGDRSFLLIYFLGVTASVDVRLSREHDRWALLTAEELARRTPFEGLRYALQLAEAAPERGREWDQLKSG